MKTEIAIIFPHQLFEHNPLISKVENVILIEEFLYFKQYKFHKQKIAFHRASMKFYETYLANNKIEVEYIQSIDRNSDIRSALHYLKEKGIKTIHYIDTCDYWLEERLNEGVEELNIELKKYNSPMFLNTEGDLKSFFKKDKKKFYQTSFYKEQRKKRNLLINSDGTPKGGSWTYDQENRKKYPAKKTPPSLVFPKNSECFKEACSYVEQHFNDNPGNLDKNPLYPIDFESSKIWLDQFLETRFHEFGPYEDAIVKDQIYLHHSILTPMLNSGLITPKEVIEKSVDFADSNNVQINSLEGFVRQIVGWREFIRGVYMVKGVEERTHNFWKFNKKIPKSFYDGSTGIQPFDDSVKKVLNTSFCHHIERLMILGNFMVLCEIDPDEVYRWFMELFIDAYDWVMVPNVYGMSQYADGGLMSTKPYISGCNYIMKMSNYKSGEWQEIWDALFWRFMHVHRDYFESNPRLAMLVRNLDRMSEEKLNDYIKTARQFLNQLK